MEQRIITADDIGFFQYMSRVWKYRSLIRILAVRDIKIHYSQTMLGVLWSVLQPLVAISIYTIFFYYVLGIKTGDVPYPLFVLPGIIGWFQFTNIINGAGMSLLENPDLIRPFFMPTEGNLADAEMEREWKRLIECPSLCSVPKCCERVVCVA